MARKLQLLPDFFVNMDNIVSWKIYDDSIFIETVSSTINVGIGAYTNNVQVTSNDLKRVINDINAYFN
ncbi:hypothetical protein [Aliivibrio fischeri]|uniref:hypothetical protein n=1 Tax=Aliivibrio fischeri TaxID=668 RepID=UPI0012DA798E|nr:hypothetical protein [Aliivibrio fischeri]MUK67669.1 hypothetical protein [Aliivibrio fischeri]